jgi:hypothetical protein
MMRPSDVEILMTWNFRFKDLEILEVLVSGHDTFLERYMLILFANSTLENPVDLLVRNIFILALE